MTATKIQELGLDVKELKQLLESAQRSRVKDILTVEIRKVETEIINLKLKEENSSKTNSSSTPTSPIINRAPKCYDTKINNYAWDQSDKFVNIFVSLKNVGSLESGNVYCKFTNRSMELNVKGLDNRNYQLLIKNLLEEINVEKCNWRVKTDNVIVNMSKKTEGLRWTHITASEKKASEPKVPKMNENDDPSAGLMDMMKKMYEEGDDELKRTIAKAWTESRDKNAMNIN